MHFLSLRGTPTCLPVSIASECQDKRIFARIFRYLLLHKVVYRVGVLGQNMWGPVSPRGFWDKTCGARLIPTESPQNRVGAHGQKHEGVLVQK